MDVSDLLENHESVVFVSDQKAFSIKEGSYGCTLYPLMTLSGDVIDVNAKNFPNNSRVWWHLGTSNPDQVLPGVIWVGEIEKHPGFDKHDSKKSLYQTGFVKRPVRGDKQLIEILNIDADSPDIESIGRGERLPWDYPPLGTVVLRGRKKTLGPLKCSWESLSQSISFTPVSTAASTTWEIDTKEFNEVVTKRAIEVPMNELAYSGERLFKLNICLTLTHWFNEGVAKKIGKLVDISTDDQIINWAVQQKIAEATNAEKAIVKRFVASVIDNPAEVGSLKYDRLQLLAKDYDRVIKLGESAAAVIGKSAAFEALLKKHIDAVVAKDVIKEKNERKAEIEQAIAPLEKRKKNLNRDNKELEENLKEKVAEHGKILKEKEAAILGPLRQKEIDLNAKTVELTRKEKTVTEALEQATARYIQHASTVSGEVLTHLPFLKEFFSSQSNASAPIPIQNTVPVSTDKRAPLPQPRSRQFTVRITESDFIDQFARVVEENGFTFKRDDLINFHVCMKTGALTILAGMSGTGKSSLPRLYAKALGAQEEFLEIPVRPDWLDDRDLMGFFNPLSQNYEPGRSGFVTHLIMAEQDFKKKQNGIYITSLDEMNLARVEHYFAPLLSIMEKDPEDRTIPLYPPGIGSENDPFSPHREIFLGGNLRFVGTVNIDETTHFFSPKLIDRSQIISLTGNGLIPSSLRKVKKVATAITPVPYEIYSSWLRTGKTVSPQVETFLLAVHEILQPSRMGFEYRALTRMTDYVSAALPLMTEEKALDYQLIQVIFPKFRRSAPMFKKTLTKLMEQIPKNRFPRSADILQRLADSENEEDFFQLI